MTDADFSAFICPTCGGPKTKAGRRCQKCTSGVAQGLRTFDIVAVTCPSCGGAKTPLARICMTCRKDDGDRPFPLGGTERARHGCIVSFENADGRTLTLHRSGPVRAGVRQACEDALKLDPSFRVVAVSTPESVYTDLKGRRADNQPTPERAHLAGPLAGMLHPRLRVGRRG